MVTLVASTKAGQLTVWVISAARCAPTWRVPRAAAWHFAVALQASWGRSEMVVNAEWRRGSVRIARRRLQCECNHDGTRADDSRK